MKPEISKKIIDDVKRRGYIKIKNVFYPPNSSQVKLFIESGWILSGSKIKSLTGLKNKRNKKGWIDDTLNIKNRSNRIDNFIRLVNLETGLSVWPEFYFLIDKQYRFDYAIPIHTDGRILKIAIECDGGTHMRGNSGHSSPAGIARDMDKGTRAAVNGWTLIRRTPATLCTMETIGLIKQAIETNSHRT